jgi:hypothetical protein
MWDLDPLVFSDVCVEDFETKGVDQATHKPSAGFSLWITLF